MKNALRRRGIAIAGTTQLLGEKVADSALGRFTSVERAQLAVALGGAHPELAELKHYAAGF